MRAAEVEFSAPYVMIQGTYMVRKDSPLKDVGDVDKPGIKIGVGLASVYDLYLTRTLKHATLVRAKVGGAAAGIPVFIDQKLDAAAGVREPLDAYAKEHPEMRVMPGAFEQIGQAMGTVKGKSGGRGLRARLRRGDEGQRLCRRRAQAQRPARAGGAEGDVGQLPACLVFRPQRAERRDAHRVIGGQAADEGAGDFEQVHGREMAFERVLDHQDDGEQQRERP